MWEKIGPENRYDHVAVNMEHYILVFGGMACVKHTYIPLDVIWEYNLYTEQWRKRAVTFKSSQNVPQACMGTCAAVIRSDLYVFGEWKVNHACGPKNSLWKLSMNTLRIFHWQKIIIGDRAKEPSHRCFHTGWEFEDKLWIFGGYGCSPDGFINNYGDFVHGHNNQLLYFNPSRKEWTNPQCYGMIPEPREAHATTIVQDKVSLYGGSNSYDECFDDLYALSMDSLTWTLIQTSPLKPQKREQCSLSAIAEDKLLLHGGIGPEFESLRDTWTIDLSSNIWRRYPSDLNHNCHTACQGLSNSVVVIGGRSAEQSLRTCTFHLRLEPKLLKQLALQVTYKYRTVVPWEFLPSRLIALLGTRNKQADLSAKKTLR